LPSGRVDVSRETPFEEVAPIASAGALAIARDALVERAAAKEYGLARETVRKMLPYALRLGYRRLRPVRRPKLDAWVGTLDQILEDDKARGKKQRHTANRIFERLRDEHLSDCGHSPGGISADRTSRPWRFQFQKWRVIHELFEGAA
jgi:hypothetical protein